MRGPERGARGPGSEPTARPLVLGALSLLLITSPCCTAARTRSQKLLGPAPLCVQPPSPPPAPSSALIAAPARTASLGQRAQRIDRDDKQGAESHQSSMLTCLAPTAHLSRFRAPLPQLPIAVRPPRQTSAPPFRPPSFHSTQRHGLWAERRCRGGAAEQGERGDRRRVATSTARGRVCSSCSSSSLSPRQADFALPSQENGQVLDVGSGRVGQVNARQADAPHVRPPPSPFSSRSRAKLTRLLPQVRPTIHRP